MVRQLLWLIALFITVLCGAVYYLWYSAPDYPEAHKSAGLIDRASVSFDLGDSGTAQEPITPIPLRMNLDARKVALGKRLFFEPRFSRDNTISCAHCHNLAAGGVDGLPRSTGVDGRVAKVNTLTVFNSGFNFRLFWDGRAATLEDQIEFPMQHPSEMDTTWAEVIAKLGSDASYRRDFLAIYPEGITPLSVKNAIATFERSLITPNSKFDRYLRGDKQALDSDELAGYELFKSLGCISCHQGMNVGGNLYEKLGLVGNYFADRGNVQKADFGRYNVTGIEKIAMSSVCLHCAMWR
jgi:cytochrome c peroxidase